MDSTRVPRARRALATLAASLLALGAAPVSASLVAENSAFGANTITHDTASGLRWLDLTLSTSRSYATMLDEIESGDFVGYRLASGDEVGTLFENAGIDMSEVGEFVPQNYAPILALAGFVGQLSSNGNCGSGCSFFFSEGWIDNGDPPDLILSTANMAWFDNSALLSDNYPQAPIGRVIFPSFFDGASPNRGAWLVQAPEPGVALAPAASFALAALALSRSARSARRPPRAPRR